MNFIPALQCGRRTPWFGQWSGKKVKSLGRVRLFVTPWIVAYQASPSMGFSRQEPWDFPGKVLEWVAISFSRRSSRPRIEPRAPALQAEAFTV